MNRSKWRDRTRSGKTTESELKINSVTVSVHHHKSFSPDLWFLSCENMFISMKRLKSKDLDLAKLEAVQLVSSAFEKVVKGLAVESVIAEEMMGVAP